MAYTEKQKSIARRIVNEAHGGQVSDRSLSDVRIALDSPSISISTLYSWIKGIPKKSTLISEISRNSDLETEKSKPNDLDYDNASVKEILRATLRKYAKRANNQDAVDATDGKDAVAAMERLIKLTQLLDGLPTEIVGITSDFVKLAERKGYNASQSLRDLMIEMEKEPDMITPTSGMN